jgi:7-cyano-7-deazaguanine synthase
MSLVTLTSGGLDSTLMAAVIQEAGLEQFPLFIDYGQRNRDMELNACKRNFERHSLPAPEVAELPGFGKLIPSGLTDVGLRLFEDAFLPCRNLLFLLVGAAYAYKKGAHGVAIGLLDESQALFPDQTRGFLDEAESLLSRAVGSPIKVVAPFIAMPKSAVYEEAVRRGISGTYSCHSGSSVPCGVCIACREYAFLGEDYGRRR